MCTAPHTSYTPYQHLIPAVCSTQDNAPGLILASTPTSAAVSLSATGRHSVQAPQPTTAVADTSEATHNADSHTAQPASQSQQTQLTQQSRIKVKTQATDSSQLNKQKPHTTQSSQSNARLIAASSQEPKICARRRQGRTLKFLVQYPNDNNKVWVEANDLTPSLIAQYLARDYSAKKRRKSRQRSQFGQS